jgi:formylglycine-generating enzyme required for sulfatase activity
MVAIPEGNFVMGSPKFPKMNLNGTVLISQHTVTLNRFSGQYPVTQAQWKAVAALPQINRKLDPTHRISKVKIACRKSFMVQGCRVL